MAAMRRRTTRRRGLVAAAVLLLLALGPAACGPSDDRPAWLRPNPHQEQERITIPDDGFDDFLAGQPAAYPAG